MEALTFCIKAFSESVPSDECVNMIKIFSNSFMNLISTWSNESRDGFSQFQSTMLSCISQYSEWLANQPDLLPNILNFIIICLNLPSKAQEAAKTLIEISNTCRIPLSKFADQIIEVCMRIMPIIAVNNA